VDIEHFSLLCINSAEMEIEGLWEFVKRLPFD